MDVASPPRVRDVVRAEVTKALTHPVTAPAVLGALAVNTALAVIVASDVVRLGTGGDPVSLEAFPGLLVAPVYLLLIAVATVAGGEHTTGQHRVTLTVVPRRGRLAVAQLLALVAVSTPAALLALAPARLVLARQDGSGLADGALDVGRWVLAYVLLSVVAYGLTSVVRSATTALGVLAALPVLVATGALPWPRVVRFLPHEAATAVTGVADGGVTALTSGVAVLVLGGWAVLAAAAHTASLLHREA
ncbi:hypothetical protein [Cellulomonas xiejunii]|uniref:hypothetical protein n=1 Tax=Cellulomonas xiejunii TaxID=2968083 RepID=UPI001D0E7422|nr:hypothetical protein [Cellulomonas xiejunii]MCC2313308.1 hypothetical protein [Cellulomonas xiejunii]